MGVLYILDEPSIGLHQRDNDKLLETLKNLRDMGNTLIVVEHDEDTMRAADQIIDIGPGAGENGGYVVAQARRMKSARCRNPLPASISAAGKRSRCPKSGGKETGNNSPSREPGPTT